MNFMNVSYIVQEHFVKVHEHIYLTFMNDQFNEVFDFMAVHEQPKFMN